MVVCSSKDNRHLKINLALSVTELHTHEINLYLLYHEVYFMNPHCIKSKRVKCLLCDVILAKSILKAQVESINRNYEGLKNVIWNWIGITNIPMELFMLSCHRSSAAILGNFHKMFFFSLVFSVDHLKAGVMVYGVARLAHTSRLGWVG